MELDAFRFRFSLVYVDEPRQAMIQLVECKISILVNDANAHSHRAMFLFSSSLRSGFKADINAAIEAVGVFFFACFAFIILQPNVAFGNERNQLSYMYKILCELLLYNTI